MKVKALIIFLLLLIAKISLGQYTYNKAASFNGFSSYFAIPSAAKLNFTSALKIEAWIKPTAYGTMAIVGKNFTTGYYFGLNSTGQLRFFKGNSFVESSTVVPLNVWTHVAVTYNGTQTRFFINGNQTNLVTTLTGAIPVNTDSVKIGADGSPANYFFQGEMDDVSLWNSSESSYINSDMTLSLAIPYPTEQYSGLKAAYRMNGDNGGTAIYDEVFTLSDGIARNVSFVDYSGNPAYHSSYNSSVYLGYNEGYLVSPNYEVYNSTTAITLEAWVKKDTLVPQNDIQVIINKAGGTTRINYVLLMSGNTFALQINNGTRGISYASPSLLNSRWHHLAASYNSANGSASLYLDGALVTQSIFDGMPLINNNADSLLIGKLGATGFPNTNFTGQVDEVRIWKNTVRTAAQIKANMYKNIDFTSPSAPSPDNCCIFGFDGRTYNDLININQGAPSAIFQMRGPVYLISNTNAYLLPLAKSPMLRDDANDFAGSSYQVSNKFAFIPDNNLSGLKDSVYVSAAGIVSSLKIFTFIEHATLYDLAYSGPGTGITLTSPTGTTVVLTPTYSGEGYSKDLMTIFDMSADSTIKFNFFNRYCVVPFSPKIKPANSLAAFNGQQQQGWWKLKIVDNAASSATGCLYGWGIQTQTPTGIVNQNQTAGKYELSQNYPNPFNPTTKINYKLKNSGFVKLSVFDEMGRRVAELINKNQNAGNYSMDFNADEYKLSSGIYFYRLEADGFNETKKMILLK